MLSHNLVLKSDELYMAGDIATDGSGELATGLYLRDTRHLNRFDLTLNGQPLRRLQVILKDAAHARVMTANSLVEGATTDPILPLQVLVEQSFALSDVLAMSLVVRDFGGTPRQLRLGISMGADFRGLVRHQGLRETTQRGLAGAGARGS